MLAYLSRPQKKKKGLLESDSSDSVTLPVTPEPPQPAVQEPPPPKFTQAEPDTEPVTAIEAQKLSEPEEEPQPDVTQPEEKKSKTKYSRKVGAGPKRDEDQFDFDNTVSIECSMDLLKSLRV